MNTYLVTLITQNDNKFYLVSANNEDEVLIKFKNRYYFPDSGETIDIVLFSLNIPFRLA